MSKITDEVLLLGDKLEVYGTLSTSDCPSCRGGVSKDKAFSITRLEEGLVYNCFRGTCGISGFVPSRGNVSHTGTLMPKEPTFKPNVYKYPTRGLTAEQYIILQNKFGLSMSEVTSMRVRFNPKGNSYVFPIYNSEGKAIGVVDRSYAGRRPKSLTYLEENSPLLAFPWQFGLRDKGTIYLVEDQVSALKVSRYARCVALLGCHLSEAAVRELMVLTDNIVFALDGDVTQQALRLRKKYSTCFSTIKVLHLLDDPKDMEDSQLKNVFRT